MRHTSRLTVFIAVALATSTVAAGQQCRHKECRRGESIIVPGPPGSGVENARLESYGGDFRPDVPWFTLPRAGYAPINNPTTGVVPLVNTIPYQAPVAQNWVADNPAVSGFDEHANVTRYWATNPTFFIALPTGALPTSTVASSLFAGAIPAGAGAYTWNNWSTAVQATFAAYNNVNTAAIIANFGGFNTADYTLGATTMPTQFLNSGQFVWSSLHAVPNVGPTGNGRNEIILTDQTVAAFVGGGGITSMIVNPKDGQILECDVLISAQAMFQTNGAAVTFPEEWTALRHEIGHFYGLDHTNLHPGQFAGVPGNLRPVAATSFTLAAPFNSVADFPAGPLDGIGRYVLPGMVGRITHNGPGFNHTALTAHRDDATSLSKIYPVATPSGNLTPLINVSSRIIGRHRDALLGDIGVYGRNVWAVPEGLVTGTTTTPEAYPRSGTVSGISRLSTTDCAMLGFYNRTANHPLDPFSAVMPGMPEPFFLAATSVVGASNAAPPAGQNPVVATGDFSIDGIPGGSYDDVTNPLAYEAVFEDGAMLGATSANFAEWFQEVGLYSGNPMTPATPIPPGPFVPALLRNFLSSLGPVQSGLRVVPGTVIALDPREHDDFILQVVGGGGATLSTSASGTNYYPVAESYARPLIDVQPRTGFVPGGTITVNFKTTWPAAWLINPSSIQFVVNNVPIANAAIGASFPGIGIAALTTDPSGLFIISLTLTIPMNDVLAFSMMNPPPQGCAPNAGGIHFKAIANQVATAGALAADPLANDYQTLGRNDVIF